MRYQKRPRVSHYGRLRNVAECAGWYQSVQKLRDAAQEQETKPVIQANRSVGEVRAMRRAVTSLQRDRKS